MKQFKLYALANELNLDRAKADVITIPFGTWDYGEKKLDDGRTLFFKQTLNAEGAAEIINSINASIAHGEKGIPVYWGHPDVPELAHKYPDKRAKGWIKEAAIEGNALILTVEYLEKNATEGFGWFSPYWTGHITELGNNQAMMNVTQLGSIALVNMPNIREFRLANESQDSNAAQAEKGKNMNITKEELCTALGLPPEATDEQIRAELAKVAKTKEELATAQTKTEAANEEAKVAKEECDKVKADLANEKAARRGLLLDAAIADGRISVAGRAAWDKRLTDDFAAGSLALANEKPLKKKTSLANEDLQKKNNVNLIALANELMKKDPSLTYTAAFAKVMKDHPEVK